MSISSFMIAYYSTMVEFCFKSKAALFASDFVVSFLQEFRDRGENALILSLKLKEITAPDLPTALRFLGTQTIIHMPCLSICNILAAIINGVRALLVCRGKV